MANTHATLTDLFINIANAIRSKTNKTDDIIANDFPNEIETIEAKIDYVNDQVTVIEDYAYYGMDIFKSVYFDNVTSIGVSAFENCTSLTTVRLPNTLTTIGDNAFKGCTNATIYCATSDNPENWGNNWNPDNCPVVWLGEVIETYDISARSEDNVMARVYKKNDKYILDISGTGYMREFTYFSYDVVETDIPWYQNYQDLIQEVYVNNGIQNISASVFSDCSNLVNVEIANSVTEIDGYVFRNCSSLENITLPFVGNGSNQTHFGYIFGAASYSNNSTYVPTSLKSVTITGGTNISMRAF